MGQQTRIRSRRLFFLKKRETKKKIKQKKIIKFFKRVQNADLPVVVLERQTIGHVQRAFTKVAFIIK